MYAKLEHGDGEKVVATLYSPGDPARLSVPLMSLEDADLVTGTFRSPERIVVLPANYIDQIVAIESGFAKGPVVALVVNTASRRAVVVGPFSSQGMAESWWSPSYNKLATRPDVVFAVLPIAGVSQVGSGTRPRHH
jgi:hypothetical protein